MAYIFFIVGNYLHGIDKFSGIGVFEDISVSIGIDGSIVLEVNFFQYGAIVG